MLISFPTTHYHISSYSARYTFSGKERDEETGFSYFGARYYNSDYSIWLSVDPMSDRYPSISPYAYCANNPIKLVDPSGEEIVIVGNDGTAVVYVPNMKYDGNDKGIATKVSTLNQINGTKTGRRAVEVLNQTNNVYVITDNVDNGPSEAHYCANNELSGQAGGLIVTRGNDNIKTIAHEMFHAYQDEKGQGRNSIFNEVEAMMFEFSVGIQIGLTSNPLKGENEEYNNKVDNLFARYTEENMNALVNDFKSSAKGRNTYSSYPLRRNNQNKSLLQDFYPLY